MLAGIHSLRRAQWAISLDVLEALRRHGLDVDGCPFERAAVEGLESLFDESILPALAPLTVDREHRFPSSPTIA